MNKILNLIGRTKELFQEDIQTYEKELSKIVSNSTFLVIGGAGSIGQAVTKEIFICSLLILMSFLIVNKVDNTSLQLYLFAFINVLGLLLSSTWFYQGIEKMKYITLIVFISKLFLLTSILIFIKEESDFVYVPLLFSFSSLFAGIISFIIIYVFQINIKIYSFKQYHLYIKGGWSLFISSIFGLLYKNTNIIILGLLTNNLVVGYYAIAEKIIKAIQTFQQVFGNALYPYISRKRSFLSFNSKYNKIIIIIYLTLSISIYLLSDIISNIILGINDTNTIINIKILSFVLLFSGLNHYYGVLGLLSNGKMKDYSKNIIYTGLFNIIVCGFLVLFLQDRGASISYLLSEVFLLYLMYKKLKVAQ